MDSLRSSEVRGGVFEALWQKGPRFMAKTGTKSEKLAKLRSERQKQMELYKRLPDQKDTAAQEIAGRIHSIDKDIARVSNEPEKSAGTPIWVWLLIAVAAGGLAWAGTYYYAGTMTG